MLDGKDLLRLLKEGAAPTLRPVRDRGGNHWEVILPGCNIQRGKEAGIAALIMDKDAQGVPYWDVNGVKYRDKQSAAEAAAKRYVAKLRKQVAALQAELNRAEQYVK